MRLSLLPDASLPPSLMMLRSIPLLLQAAEKEYSRCLALSQELGLTGPYILNARGNARGSLGRWEEVRRGEQGHAVAASGAAWFPRGIQ